MRTVSEVAAAAGVSVRTLHHYDEVGLLRPQERTDAGYRLYSDADLRRLHTILFWRSLGFPLEEVRALLDDPQHDALEAMRLHRARLLAEVGALNARIEALDTAIAHASGDQGLTNDDLRTLFDGFDPSVFEEEVAERWGDTPEFQESKRRTARYGKREWEAIKAEASALNARMVELCRAGVAPAEAREVVAAHRSHIDRWFYPVSPELHMALAKGYVDDPRFAATYERMLPGLSIWLRDAILAAYAPRPRTL